MAKLLNPEAITAPLLAQVYPDDEREGLAIVAAALVRGQGKTAGLHRRTVQTSRVEEIEQFGDVNVLDRVGDVAMRRANDAWETSRKLRRALIILMSGGEDRDDIVRARDGEAESWTMALRRFEQRVDSQFFDNSFWTEAINDSANDRLTWRKDLRAIAEDVLAEAAESAPRTITRREKSRARAENRLERDMNAWLKEVALGDYV